MPRGLIGLIAAAVLAILTAPLWRQAIPRIQSLTTNATNFDTSTSQSVTFVCANADSFQVEYGSGAVRLILSIGGSQELGQTGTNRYSNGEYTFYTQNNLGYVERNEVLAYNGCTPQASIPSPSPTLSPSPSPTTVPSPSPTSTPISGAVTYTCQDGRRFQVRYYSSQAELYMEGVTYYLSQVPSASGTQYTDGNIVLITQGDRANIDINGFAVYTNCIADTSGGGTWPPSPQPSPPNALW